MFAMLFSSAAKDRRMLAGEARDVFDSIGVFQSKRGFLMYTIVYLIS